MTPPPASSTVVSTPAAETDDQDISVAKPSVRVARLVAYMQLLAHLNFWYIIQKQVSIEDMVRSYLLARHWS